MFTYNCHVIDQILEASRKKVKEVIEIEPKMKVAYGLLCALRNIFSKCKTRKRAKKALHKWYKVHGVGDLPLFMFRCTKIFG